MSMKLRVPPDCGAVSYGGRTLEIDDAGYIDADEHAAQALQAHNIHAAGGEAEQSEEALSSEPAKSDIEGLSRRGLFAFLKAKGVSVSLPVTNEALRAMARNAAEGIGH